MAAITDLSSLSALAQGDLLVVHDADETTDKKVAVQDLIGVESTWTPTLSFGGGSTGMTYADRSGTYKRIAHLNIVLISGYVALSAKGSSTGSAAIGNLPVTPASGVFVVPCTWSSLNSNWVTVLGYVNSGLMYLVGATAAAAGTTNLTDTAFDNDSIVYWTGFYFE